MGDLLTSLMSLSFLAALIRWTVPLGFGALGGLISERAGVINLAIEGFLTAGAFGAACGAYLGQSGTAGLLAGALAGAILALLMAVLVVKLRADAVIVGVAINLAALALARYLLKRVFGSAANSPPLTEVGSLFGTASLSQLATNPLLWLLIISIIATHQLFARTRAGLRISAIGEAPDVAYASGIPVAALQIRAVVVSGAVAGLGGAWLTLALGGYSSGMVAGRGYIAVAAVLFAQHRPLYVLGASLLFGFFHAVSVQLRLAPAVLSIIPDGYLLPLPYVFTLVALVIVAWRRTRTQTRNARQVGAS